MSFMEPTPATVKVPVMISRSMGVYNVHGPALGQQANGKNKANVLAEITDQLVADLKALDEPMFIVFHESGRITVCRADGQGVLQYLLDENHRHTSTTSGRWETTEQAAHEATRPDSWGPGQIVRIR